IGDAPRNTIHPTAPSAAWAATTTTASIRTATARIQKPAGRDARGGASRSGGGRATRGPPPAARRPPRYRSGATPQRGHRPTPTGCHPHFGHDPSIALGNLAHGPRWRPLRTV